MGLGMLELQLQKGVARCSAGWNKFAKDNMLKINQTVLFNMLADEGNRIIFEIHIF